MVVVLNMYLSTYPLEGTATNHLSAQRSHFDQRPDSSETDYATNRKIYPIHKIFATS